MNLDEVRKDQPNELFYKINRRDAIKLVNPLEEKKLKELETNQTNLNCKYN